jgi:glutamyl/glutaminyl-tRNA synthetase
MTTAKAKDLSGIRRQLGSERVVTRFAPSPTGFLHLGHVAAALFVYGVGRRLGALTLLRLEDHDRTRCQPKFEAAVLDDLRWLGLVADNHDEFAPGRPTPYRQSDRRARYDHVLAALAAAGALYACDCSRKRIAASRTAAADVEVSELLYDGHCRDRGLTLGAPDTGIRWRMPASTEAFVDGWLGPLTHHPATQCGDLLLRDRHGCDTYQFAVTVDDLDQDVSLVIRGEDLLASTGRQLALRRQLLQLGLAPSHLPDPVFAHHALIRDEAGIKLSKRRFSEAVASRRAAGESAAAVLGDAAHRVGLTEQPAPLSAADLPQLFG